MALNYGVAINLNKNELQNARLQNLASDPGSPVLGQCYFNTTTNKFRTYNGSTWDEMGSGSATGDVSSNTATSVDSEVVLFNGTTGKSVKRASITGLAKLTSGVLSAAVAGTDYGMGDVTGQASSVDSEIALFSGTGGKTIKRATTTGLLKATSGVLAAAVAGTDYLTGSSSNALTNKSFDANGTGNSITNIETADFATNVVDNDATLAANSATRLPTQQAVKAYVDNAVAGLDWKDSVRVATTAAGTLASSFANGQTVDGVTLATGDRILIKNQSAGAENGIYVVAASGAPTRASDADTGAEVWGAAVYIREGTTNGGGNWVNTNTSSPTIGVTALTFVQFKGQIEAAASTTSSGIVELATAAEAEAKTDNVRALTPLSVANFPVKKIFTIGDGAATSIACTHNLNTTDVVVSVYKVSTGDEWLVDVTRTSANVVTIGFATAPASNEFKVVIIG